MVLYCIYFCGYFLRIDILSYIATVQLTTSVNLRLIEYLYHIYHSSISVLGTEIRIQYLFPPQLRVHSRMWYYV